MKKAKLYKVVPLFVFICIYLGIVLLTADSSTSRAANNESVELGEIITLYKTPYLNDHSIIYNPKEQKWHFYIGIDFSNNKEILTF